MTKKINLTETELTRLIEKVIKEQDPNGGNGYNRDLGEQGMSGLPTDGMPPVAPENETEISPEMTHDQFMDQLDGMCPEIIKQEKRVGKYNCGKCHTEEMILLRKYCKTRAR
jgi:hypothetical protein